jgi:hypothetical protein
VLNDSDLYVKFLCWENGVLHIQGLGFELGQDGFKLVECCKTSCEFLDRTHLWDYVINYVRKT